MRRTRQIADAAEEARDKTHREVTEPLRKMRQGDHLTPAVVNDIRRQQRREG